MNKPNSLSRFQGCLLGVAIGDSMGMPWETMTYAEIQAITRGLGVYGFSAPMQSRINGTRNLKAGDTTDDWQLTAAIARSIIQRKGFDIVDIAGEHITEYDRSVSGWGGTTKTSLRNIKKWFETGGREGQDPRMPAPDRGPGQGVGNGVAMKVAPLALMQAELDSEALFERAMVLGRMTHCDPRASFAAYAVARLITTSAIDIATRLEIGETDHELINGMLLELVDELEHREESYLQMEHPSIGDRLMAIWRMEASDLDPDRLRMDIGTGCLCIESVPFAIGTFFRHLHDFRAGVLEAVNAGGDTDSTASIVGALIGANVGLEGIPDEWRTFRPEFQEALNLGEQLWHVVGCP